MVGYDKVYFKLNSSFMTWSQFYSCCIVVPRACLRRLFFDHEDNVCLATGWQKRSQSSESISCRAVLCQESACCCCALQLQYSASSICERINSCATQILTLGYTLLGDSEMETLVMCRIDRGLMVFMRKNYPYVANEQFELGILKAEDNEEEEDELTVDLDLQKEFSSQ